MKKLIILSLLLALFTFKEASARKKVVPYCSDCEYVIPVADLPDKATFYSDEYKEFVDVGYMYKQFWLLWITIWNYEGKYVLTIKNQEVFFDLSEEDLKNYKDKYHLHLPENPISLWNKAGGKMIIALILALIIYGLIPKKNNDEQNDEVSN